MKILIYAPGTIFDGTAGNCIHVRELAKNLSILGHEVVVVAKLKDTCYKCSGVTVKPTYFSNIFPFTSGLFTGVKMIICWKPEILYIRGMNLGGILLLKISKSKKITEINELLDEEIKFHKMIYKNTNKIKLIWRTILNKVNFWSWEKSIVRSDKIITVTPEIKRQIIRRYNVNEAKITCITNGANIELFRPIDNIKVRKELNFDKDINYICFIGNLAPWQGVEYLIQSAPAIINEIPNTKFLITGDGLMKKELMNLAKKTGVSNKFIFTGEVLYEDVPKYINVSSICVVYKKPLKSGYSPLKLYEYMACGRPVVASKVDGFEILEEQNAGILVEPENPKELAMAIVKLLRDENLRNEMGRNGREYIVKNLSWESVARRVVEVYRDSFNQNS